MLKSFVDPTLLSNTHHKEQAPSWMTVEKSESLADLGLSFSKQ